MSISSSSFNIDGIISGLSTGSIIDKLMSLERMPVTSLTNKQTGIKTRDTAYQALRGQARSFQSALKNLLLSNNVNTKTTTTDKTGVVSVNAGTAAINGSFTVAVDHLATASTVSTSGSVSVGVDPTKPLASAGFATTPTSGTFTVNGQQITVNAATQSLNDMVTALTDNGTTIRTGVTASLVRDSNNQVTGLKLTPIVGNTNPIQLGAGADTSNFLSATHLVANGISGAAVQSTGVLGTTPTGNALSSLTFANLASQPALDPSGNFTINGVSIAWQNTDTLTTIINRINSSTAGVVASYDSSNDRMTLSNANTGNQSISLADNAPTGSGLLKALGVSAANQTVGKTAQYTITQNGTSTTAYSNSNTVANALPGVSLTLLKNNDSATVSVAQDTQTASKNVQAFVDQYNSLVDLIDKDTAYDATQKQASVLTGDSGVVGFKSQIRGALTAFVTGGTYATLDSIGVSTGAFGAAVGTTNHLQLDQNKLNAALQANPNAVSNVMGGAPTALVNPAGSDRDGARNWMAALSGTPTSSTFGRYQVSLSSDGTLSSVFTPSGQQSVSPVAGSLSAAGVGGTNSTLIPGITISAANFPPAGTTLTDTIWVGQPGVLGRLNDMLNRSLGTGGVFDAEANSASAQLKDLDTQIQAANGRLTKRQQTLQAQFTAMELALVKLQGQGTQLAGSLGTTPTK
jgi:flagellar hook-associated protein 2